MHSVTDLLRRWGIITAVVWFLGGSLYYIAATDTARIAASWPIWTGSFAILAGIASVALAVWPRRPWVLRLAVLTTAYACAFRAVALLMADLPKAPDALRLIGVVFWIGMGETIVILGVVFARAQQVERSP